MPRHCGGWASWRQDMGDLTPERETRLRRIVVDHTRAATFLLADGVLPGNVERGYVCRRLIRRAALSAHALGVREPSLAEIARTFISDLSRRVSRACARGESHPR